MIAYFPNQLSYPLTPMKADFVIIDTEGNPELREIAIVDSQGKLIYEAFVQEHPINKNIKVNVKPLAEIINNFLEITKGKGLVFHHANHDLNILKYSLNKLAIPYKAFPCICTYETAQRYLPQAPGFSLESLSRYLNLKVNGKLFNSAQAHTARYDAYFTYQLYLELVEIKHKQAIKTQLNQITNPFSSSRVDNPFQSHLDFKELYHQEFQILKSIIEDIKTDVNHQSKGAVVIGEAGSGKTHLMMRIAQELLTTNRLLFIRQPNNPESVLYHTYARILESFAEKVIDKNNLITENSNTQLELLLANSFVKILSSLNRVINTQKGKEIVEELRNNSLSLYSRLGKDGTQKNLERWQFIEKNILEWWSNQYTAAGYSTNILQGIIKFCSYRDVQKKELVRRWLAASELEPEEAQNIGLENWREEMSREEFALEAIKVFGKLSTLDEPLIIVFDQLEGLGLPHNTPILASFGEAVKEILTHVPNSLVILNLFPERYSQFKDFFDSSVVERISQHKISLNRPSSQQLEGILTTKAKLAEISLDELFTPLELNDIIAQKSVRSILNRASDYFQYKTKNIPLATKPLPDISQPNLEDRVNKLENLIQQISILISPYLVNNSQEQPSEFFCSATVIKAEKLAVKDKINIYFEEQKKQLWQSYDKPTIINDDGEVGKLNKIVEAFNRFENIRIDQLRYGKIKLPDNLLIETSTKKYGIAFLNGSGNTFTGRIKNFNQLVVSEPAIQFRLIRDIREPQINPKTVGQTEIDKLNHTKNGTFTIMDREDRVNFELMHKLVTDIQEKDLEVDLDVALKALETYLKSYWLISVLTP